MNKLKMILLSVLTVGLVSVGLAGIAQAQSFSMTVPAGKTVDSSVYSAGKQVVIEGTVNGDVYCGGDTITIKGVVKGDVICAGRHVILDGVIEGDARIAGQRIELKRTIAGSATIAGSEVTMSKDATIGRDMTLTASNVNIRGSIGRDMVANGTKHIIEARIGRNLNFSGAQLALYDKAFVGGGVYYHSKQDMEKAKGAVVKGEVDHLAPKEQTRRPFGADSKTMFMAALVMFIFAMVLVLFAPQQVHKTNNFAVTSLAKTALIGGLSIIVAPVVIVLLCTSVLALPVGLTLLFIMLLVVMVSGPIAGYYIGSMILSKSKNPIHIMALGSAVMLALYMLPLIGPFFMLVAYIIGAGAALRTIRQLFPKPVYRVE